MKVSDDDAPRPLGDEDLATWASLATMLEWLPPALDAPLRGLGLTHFEYGVLFALANAPEQTLRLSVLAEYANSSLSRLSRAVSRLEAQGWARRGADPADGRSTLAVLTDDGEQRLLLATPRHEENVRRLVLDGMTTSEKRQLLALTTRVNRTIRESGAWPGPA